MEDIMNGNLRILIKFVNLLTIFVLFLLNCSRENPKEVPLLRVGHVGHDHHTALYVAALNGDLFKKNYNIYLKEIRAKQLYELYNKGKKVCEIELFKAGGGSIMPTEMAQGNFDVGFGGLAAIAFFVDKGTPMKIISPLHSKGDMLVVNKKIKADNWEAFVNLVKEGKEPLKIGFKAPKAIALLIFEAALKEEGITFTYDASDKTSRILLMNLKGAKNLNPALLNGIIDGYVCNNPFCAIAEENGTGKSIADLNDLPPGLWKEHPCCVIGAMESIIKEKRDAVVKFLELIVIATELMNKDSNIAVQSASKWIGTSIGVESKSIPTSGYLTEPDESWLNGSYVWAKAMQDLGHIKGTLKDKNKYEIEELLLDLTLIKEARKNVEKRNLKF